MRSIGLDAIHFGVSSFVAFTVILAISVSVAISVYALLSNFSIAYRPVHRVSTIVLCYNVSGYKVVTLGNLDLVNMCINGDLCYLCSFLGLANTNVAVVFKDKVVALNIERDYYLVLLDDVPLHIYGSRDGNIIEGKVKMCDPWTK